MAERESSIQITVVILGLMVMTCFPITTSNLALDDLVNLHVSWLLLIASALSLLSMSVDFVNYLFPPHTVEREEPLKDRMRREFEEDLYRNHQKHDERIGR